MENIELNLGDYFYYINQYGKFIRKVTFKNEYFFEWNAGFAEVNQLKINQNKKSKVKFILTDF
jgi:hypothetical protein